MNRFLGCTGAQVLRFRFFGFWVQVHGSARRLQRSARMGARSFDQLDCWQLSTDLKRGVYALVDTTAAARDLEFRVQIRRSAASAPSNIAEGFGRYNPKEFAQYLRVANGSLMETSAHLHDGIDRGYFRPEVAAPLFLLARRASAATTRLIMYLATAKPPSREPEPTNPGTGTRAPKNR